MCILTNSGYKAIVVTVDSPTSGKRERDLYNTFNYPKGMAPMNFLELFEEMKDIRKTFDSVSEFVVTLYDSSICWKDIQWLQSITPLPIIVKGIACFTISYYLGILSPKGTVCT